MSEERTLDTGALDTGALETRAMQTGIGSPASDQASTAAKAHEAAGDVAATTAESAKQVAREASGEVKNLAHQAHEQLSTLMGQSSAELRQQASVRSTQAAEGLRTLAGQLQALAAGNAEGAGPLMGYIAEARQRAESLAARLEERGADGALEDMSRFARRRPGAFLAFAAGAGVLAGRMVRAGRSNSDSGTSAMAGIGPQNYRQWDDPSPENGGYAADRGLDYGRTASADYGRAPATELGAALPPAAGWS